MTPNQMVLIHLLWGKYQEGMLSTDGGVVFNKWELSTDGISNNLIDDRKPDGSQQMGELF